VVDKFWKDTFSAWELNEIYDYISSNYKSQYDTDTYTIITKKLKKFVDKWWKVEFI
jgi:hypothetical protein